MANPSQKDLTLLATNECVEVFNVDKSNFTKNLVLTNGFKVKQLHQPRTQCYAEGDYLLVAEFKDTTTEVDVNFYRVDPNMILTPVGQELKDAMQAAMSPDILKWLLERDFVHKQILSSLQATKNCYVYEKHMAEFNSLFRGLPVPRFLLKCTTHHLYTGLPENLFSDVKVFEEKQTSVAPERTQYEGGAFKDTSWLVFYGNGKARFVNESTTAVNELPLQNACMAYKFVNDRRPGKRFLDIECWVNPVNTGL